MYKKKALLLVIVTMLMITMSSCGERLSEYAETDLNSQMAARFDENQRLLSELHDAGFITDDEYSNYSSSIQKNRDKYCIQDLGDKGESYVKMVSKAIVGLRKIDSDIVQSNNMYITLDDGEIYAFGSSLGSSYEANTVYKKNIDNDGNVTWSSKYTKEEFNDKLDEVIASNYIYKQDYSNKRTRKMTKVVNGVYYDTNYSDIGNIDNLDYDENNCIEVIPKEDIDALERNLEERFAYEVFVLDPSKISSENGIDEITGVLQNSEYVHDGIVESGVLDAYFMDSGEKLFNGDIPEIFKITTKNTGFDPNDDECGKDVMIKQLGQPILSLRLFEINKDGVEDLIKRVGINKDKYIFERGSNGYTGRVYLLEYPVDIINEVYTSSSGIIQASTTESCLGINIKNQSMIKYDTESNGSVMLNGTVIGNGISDYQSYLNIGGAASAGQSSCSSFIISNDGKAYLDSFGANGHDSGEYREIETVKIVLRDYLELTYTADYNSSGTEDMYAFGRMMRVNISNIDSDGTLTIDSDTFAHVVDTNGESVKSEDGVDITITPYQIIDLSGSSGIWSKEDRDSDSYSVKRLANISNGETDGQQISLGISGEYKIASLPITAVSQVQPVTRFPGDKVDKVDTFNMSDSLPVLYAIGTSTDMFETALYSSWIESDSSTASLGWWINWLDKCGFRYSLSKGSIEDYLVNEYAYELSQEGVVVLDLDTVSKIQTDIDDYNSDKSDATRRAIFRGIGYIIITYAVIILICWVFDTQLDTGVRLLSIATFGKWVAIKYKSDIPDYDKDSKYATLGRMLISFCVMIALGRMLVSIDMVSVVYSMIKRFGNVAEAITELVK